MLIQVIGCRGIGTIEGGIERHVEKLYPNLIDDDLDVELLLRSPYRNGITGDRINGMKARWLWAPKSGSLETIVHSFIAVLVAAVSRPDVLHIHGIGPAIFTPLAKMFGLRVVVTHHGFDYEREKWGNFARFVLKTGERLGARYADSVIGVSDTIRDRLAENFAVSATSIPNGVDLPPLREAGSVLQSHGLCARKYVLQVSRFVPEKRQADLVRAFTHASLDGWKLALVGDVEGSEYADEVRAAANDNQNVVLTGLLTGPSLEEVYGNASAFVLPSSHEGLPIVILEALSYGLPVIASDIKPNKELPLPETCYFKVGDVDALTERLCQLPRGWDEHSAKQRRDHMANCFSWASIATKTKQVLMAVNAA